MRFFDDQLRAILWAQLRAIFNRSAGKATGGRAFFWVLTGLWYVVVALGAWMIATGLPQVHSAETLRRSLGIGLFLAFLFWQFVPVMLATTGLSLELRRLLVYPIPPSRLFGIEVALRATTGVEVLILMTGTAIGLWRSPIVPFWGPVFFVPYALFNMFLSAGVRDLLARLLARRGVRELVIFGIVLLSALPQLAVVLFPPETWKQHYAQYVARIPGFPWPWQLAGQLVIGRFSAYALIWSGIWLGLAAWFGYSQFQRGLKWDAAAQRSKERDTSPAAAFSFMERIYRLPSRLLPDPLGALVEKEIRFLSRAPRFRLIFFMGFSFGLIIWLPVLLRGNRQQGFFGDNFLVWVSLYAALLLGEVLFWNTFGFDRTAAQAYYVFPVRLSTVLIAKNITAAALLLIEVTAVTAVVLMLRLRVPWVKIPESYAVTLMLCLFLMAVGNLASTNYPRPVDPAQSWRHSSSGKVQGMLLLLYPLLGMPIAMAYLARYAFETDMAFYAVLGSGLLVAAITYWVSLESSAETADRQRESILAALSSSEGPIG